MNSSRLLAALVPLLLASTAHAAVESKSSFRGQTADAFFSSTSSDGCRVTQVGVLSNELQQKQAVVESTKKKVDDVFAVVTLNIFDQCGDPGLPFYGYADTTLDQDSFTLSIEPQHDRARLQARLVMQEDGFIFYWITVDVSWTIGGPATTVEWKDYVETGDGITVWRTKGKFEERPARAVASVSVVPYYPGEVSNHRYVGEGISFSLDSITTPEEAQSLNRYSKTKAADRILYRPYEYIAP